MTSKEELELQVLEAAQLAIQGSSQHRDLADHLISTHEKEVERLLPASDRSDGNSFVPKLLQFERTFSEGSFDEASRCFALESRSYSESWREAPFQPAVAIELKVRRLKGSVDHNLNDTYYAVVYYHRT